MRVAVVGAGIGGLAAAFALARAGLEVVVFESTAQIGGKLRTHRVGDVTVDVGAEAMLARRPEAVDLLRDVGWADRIVPPAASQSALVVDGGLTPMPRTVLGVPGSLDSVAELGVRDVRRARLPLPTADESVGAFVEARLGRDVVDRLVDPMLSGVFAGDVDALSVQAAAPVLLELGSDLMAGAAARLEVAMDSPALVGVTGGLGSVPGRIAEVGGFEVRTSQVVLGIHREGQRFRLSVGRTSELFDGVIVATAPPAASRLLAELSPQASFALAGMEQASVAVISFVLADASLPDVSGFLVPRVEGGTVKAATFSSKKWEWIGQQATGVDVLRCSVGRFGETTALHYDDATLVQTALSDLRALLGSGLGQVVDHHVQRWGGGLPQYTVGHLDEVQTIMTDLSAVPGVEVCGAAYHGMGIPAVIASAHQAVQRLRSDFSGSFTPTSQQNE